MKKFKVVFIDKSTKKFIKSLEVEEKTKELVYKKTYPLIRFENQKIIVTEVKTKINNQLKLNLDEE